MRLKYLVPILLLVDALAWSTKSVHEGFVLIVLAYLMWRVIDVESK